MLGEDNRMPDTAAGGAVASRRQTIYAIVASVLGWALDLFDLFILLYVAPVIGALFFPSSHPTLSLAAVYASFAVTLLMRPLGSALFGAYADSHGRKGAMVVAVTGVGLATAAFGLLPTIGQVGLLAPALFLVLRLVQGIFVGGVVASTHTIGTESVPARYRGLMSGLVGGGGAAIGALLASLVFLAASWAFPGDSFAVWGWRVMFFAGIMSSVLGLFVFRSLEESPFYQRLAAAKAARPKPAASPLRTVFGSGYRNVLMMNLLITTGAGAGYYLTSGFLPSFLKLVNGVPNAVASQALILASFAAFAAAVLVGWVSDRIGRRPTFLIVGLCEVVLLPVCYFGLAAATTTAGVFGYSVALAFLGNAGYAPVLIFLNERFPTELRASGTGLSWNIGFAIGGIMPTFVSLASGGPSGLPMALSAFAVALFALYLLGALLIPETRGRFE
jgi:MFS family permease